MTINPQNPQPGYVFGWSSRPKTWP